ncbi:MAG: transcription-repair coupling factor [Pseudomonadota bacterium]|nr:transcription-repair coupling factor [Pseudomonadota bacterium]
MSLFPALSFPQKTHESARWGTLTGSAQALAILQAAEQSLRPLLVVMGNSQSCDQLEQELRFFDSNKNLTLLRFPSWETLPYDHFSAHEDIISERIRTLHQLPKLTQGIVLVSINALMLNTPPKVYIQQHALSLKTGDTLDIETFRQQQSENGYQHTHSVYSHGEFTVRGSIIDIFPMGSSAPVRIELFDDEIDSLRFFDPETQTSTQKINAVDLLPAREYPLNQQDIPAFQQRWIDQFDEGNKEQPLYHDISQGIPAPGAEYFLPLFFDQTATLLDYLPENTALIIEQRCQESAARFWETIVDRHDQLSGNRLRPILKPAQIAKAPQTLFAELKPWPRAQFTSVVDLEQSPALSIELPDISVDQHEDKPLLALQRFLDSANSHALICADSSGRLERLLELLNKSGLKAERRQSWDDFINNPCPLAITQAQIERGCYLPEQQLIIISETELFGQHQVLQRRRRQQQQETNPDLIIKNLAELSIGELVVHHQHGIGRYLGLLTMEAAGQKQEFMQLEYAGESKLYVPVYALHQISRYSASGLSDEAIALHTLGTEQWSRQREKAQKQIYDTAAELLETYAKREASKGHAYELDDTDYQKFASAFSFEETPDQADAIQAVLNDMQSKKPMDRLVCGDVGFGKTEVAMRAAFMAVSNNKQVLVLAPTTLLVKQHYENFVDRFSEWPVRVGQLSRFNSSAEQKKALAELESGQLDIVIGTHKLIQETVKPKALGLIIVDEEHRFGVRQKEQLKKYKASTDILTLTATPIPRTLNLAMGGLRDLSIIATPPARRLTVKTFVTRKEPALVKEAIYRELLRGGQVYYLHNEVKDIESIAQALMEQIPEAKVAVAHGQMRERELENIMSDFYHRRFNILVCTTIIETGIDVPNANTIIIERADKFGLAQLHQLRGRVGRSHHQAYAYLLTPPPKTLTKDATKRLNAIESADSLGAGFILASQDLEIRGAGAILGEQQSGNHMHHIGYSLYMELLEKSVSALKEGKNLSMEELAEGEKLDINLGMSALIPDDYLPDVHNRLMLYKRISAAKTTRALEELQIEMIDRFGLLPEPAKHLFQINVLRLKAQPLQLERIDAHAGGGSLRFGKRPNINPAALIDLVQKQYGIFKLEGQEKLKFSVDLSDVSSRFEFIDGLIEALTPKS